MRFSNRESFVISAPGALDTPPSSLESIMAGNAAGARGCLLPLDATSDGITLVCAEGYYCTRAGEQLRAADHDYLTLRAAYPKIVTLGQALELAKSCAAKLGLELRHPAAAAQARVSLKYSEYVENAYFCGLDLSAAMELAGRYPDLQVMADLTAPPDDPFVLVRQCQEAGVFGLRGAAAVLSEELCAEALRCGLFLASTDTCDEQVLADLLLRGVNFIETRRPDLADALLPQPVFEPAPAP